MININVTKIKSLFIALVTSVVYILIIRYDIRPYNEILFPTELVRSGKLFGTLAYLIPVIITIVLGLLTKSSLKDKFINALIYVCLFYLFFGLIFFLVFVRF